MVTSEGDIFRVAQMWSAMLIKQIPCEKNFVMYTQQRRDLEGSLQHHRGFQQSNFKWKVKLNCCMGRFQPIPSPFQNAISNKHCASTISKNKCTQLQSWRQQVFFLLLRTMIVPCSWWVLKENVCALVGTQVCDSQYGEPAQIVHEQMKIFTPKNAGYTLHDLLNGLVCSHWTSVCTISCQTIQWKLDMIVHWWLGLFL